MVLSSCGGGGAAGNPAVTGAVSISPSEATIYAGVPSTFQVLGGRKPYALSSSEPTIFPVPSQLNSNSFTVVPSNPGVIDAGLQAGELPVRTVTLTVHSGDGFTATATIKVGQNFLTGYGATFTPTTCPAPASGSTAGNVVCSGGETAVRFQATTDGALHGDEAFNLYILRGSAILVDPATGANGQTLTLRSDHSGTVNAIIRVAPNQPTQLGVLRIQEASTGVYTDTVFVITGGTSATTLTALPTDFTFTGPDSATCGTGSGRFEVFDGVPPYTAISSNAQLVQITPASTSAQPGIFTVAAGNPGLCGTATIVVADSVGARATVTVTTEAGSNTPPAPSTPISVAPSSLTLDCGQTASFSVAGGTGSPPSYSASSSDPNLGLSVSGSTVSVTRNGTLPALDATPKTSTVTVSDGSSFASVSVTAPTTCSP